MAAPDMASANRALSAGDGGSQSAASSARDGFAPSVEPGQSNRQPYLWADLCELAGVLSHDAIGLGGVVLRGAPGPLRDAFLAELRRAASPAQIHTSKQAAAAPWRTAPSHVTADRLLGGLDLAGTLAAGQPVYAPGLFAEADGGWLICTMVERWEPGATALVTSALDAVHQRPGGPDASQQTHASGPTSGGSSRATRRKTWPVSISRFAVVALDEGIEPDEAIAPSLAERLAFTLDLTPGVADLDLIGAALRPSHERSDGPSVERENRPSRSESVDVPLEVLTTCVEVASALGIAGIRCVQHAIRAARARAGWQGRTCVDADDLAFATRWVLAPRATTLPAPVEPDDPPPDDLPPDEPPPENSDEDQTDDPSDTEPDIDPPDQANDDDDELEDAPILPTPDQVIAAAMAHLPAEVLAGVLSSTSPKPKGAGGGRFGVKLKSRQRGRAIGSRAGSLRAPGRIHLVETLRAAAPWQPIRRRTHAHSPNIEMPSGAKQRVFVRPDDVRLIRYKDTAETVTVFLVDASGSSALERLAETKGAVELFLAGAYSRRDSVALVAFRGHAAELILPPTRALARARRALAGLPGGGGTPLAAGLATARGLVETITRSGRTARLVALTDGRPNVARDGRADRPRAAADALAEAQAVASNVSDALVLDTGARPTPFTRELASALGARHLWLPRARAEQMAAEASAGTAVL